MNYFDIVYQTRRWRMNRKRSLWKPRSQAPTAAHTHENTRMKLCKWEWTQIMLARVPMTCANERDILFLSESAGSFAMIYWVRTVGVLKIWLSWIILLDLLNNLEKCLLDSVYVYVCKNRCDQLPNTIATKNESRRWLENFTIWPIWQKYALMA